VNKIKSEEKWTWWDDVKFEIDHFYNYNIRSPIKNTITGFSNLWKWRKIIWNDRWWDYSFFLKIVLFKLKDIEEHWGKDTHYVNDLDEKETLQKLIKDLEWMLDEEKENEIMDKVSDLTEGFKNYDQEYKKISSRFFGRLDRHHRKFWD